MPIAVPAEALPIAAICADRKPNQASPTQMRHETQDVEVKRFSMKQTLSRSEAGTTFNHLPVAYSEVDQQGILRVVNDMACQMHCLSAEEMLGHPVWEFVPADEVEQDRAEFFRVLESGITPPVIRRNLYNRLGGFRTYELHRKVLQDVDGRPSGLSSVTLDVTESETALREIRQDGEWLASALVAIPQAILVTDALGFVRYLNPAAERLTGWLADELVGQQFEKGMPILRASSRTSQPLSFRITLLETWHGDVELLNRSRETISVWLSACPIFDETSKYTRGVVIVLGTPKARPAAE